MQVSSIKFFNFRNLKDQEIIFSPGFNMVVGRNGQGKTNLVEAISFLSSLKSFRTSESKDLVKWGHDSASVFGKVVKSGEEIELGVSIERGSRKAYLNGEQVKVLSKFLGQLVCISFSPTDIGIVKGAPEGRRKLIDRHLVDLNPSLIHVFMDYAKGLKSKSNLLRAGCRDKEAIRSWNRGLAQNGEIILSSRLEFVSELAAITRDKFTYFSPSDGEIHLVLKTGVTPGNVASSLENYLDKEIAAQRCLIGPHRDDIDIILGGNEAKAFASQGQSRSIILAIKLAIIDLVESKLGDSPVILLDDVDSELDEGRSNLLFELIIKQGKQVFVTSTEARRKPLIEATKDHSTLTIEMGGTQPDSIIQ